MGELEHHLELFELDVGRVVVLAKEHAKFLAQDIRPLLENDVDVAEGYVLDLGD